MYRGGAHPDSVRNVTFYTSDMSKVAQTGQDMSKAIARERANEMIRNP
eukprot:gene2481-3837_t